MIRFDPLRFHSISRAPTPTSLRKWKSDCFATCFVQHTEISQALFIPRSFLPPQPFSKSQSCPSPASQLWILLISVLQPEVSAGHGSTLIIRFVKRVMEGDAILSSKAKMNHLVITVSKYQ